MASPPPQQRKAPGTFDAFKLARERGMMEGVLDVEASDRLADRLAEGPGSIRWRIEGTVDGSGRHALAIMIEGSVPLECQRTLETFVYPVAQRTIAVLAKNESEADALDAGCDDEVLVADHIFDPVVLVEDELLLTLPYAPMRPDSA